jgi:hypothetical protein
MLLVWIALTGVGPFALHAQDRPDYNIDTANHMHLSCAMRPVYAYFQVKGKYPESSQSLAGRADARLSGHKTYGDANGHVTFQVLIDCEGRLAAVKLLQTNARYDPCFFPKELVDELYSFLRSLKAWKPAVAAGGPVNYTAYLSFKLEGGHVVQVSP